MTDRFFSTPQSDIKDNAFLTIGIELERLNRKIEKLEKVVEIIDAAVSKYKMRLNEK